MQLSPLDLGDESIRLDLKRLFYPEFASSTPSLTLGHLTERFLDTQPPAVKSALAPKTVAKKQQVARHAIACNLEDLTGERIPGMDKLIERYREKRLLSFLEGAELRGECHGSSKTNS